MRAEGERETMDDWIELVPILVVVSLAAAVGFYGHAKGKSFAESRARSSLAWQEYTERKEVAESEFSSFLDESEVSFQRNAAEIDNETESQRQRVAQEAEQAKATRDAVLSELRRRRDACMAARSPDKTPLADSVENSVDISRRFDSWCQKEKQDDWHALFDAEDQAKIFRGRIAQLEANASAKGTKPKDDPGWSRAKEPLAAVEKVAKERRASLEDEFVKTESAAILSRVRTQISGDESSPGLSARIKALDEMALTVIAEVKDHMLTPEERAAAEAPSLVERAGDSVKKVAERTGDGVKKNVSKGWKAAKSLFARDTDSDTNPEGDASEEHTAEVKTTTPEKN